MPLGEANSPGSIRRNQKSQLKTNRHADFSLPIRTMTAVGVVCAEAQIFRTTRNSALPLIMRA
jgi:hypothetical protein